MLLFLVLMTYRYIACYKPALTLCSLNVDILRSEKKGRPPRNTLADMNLPGGLHIMGRLDRNSEGLLLLTDDGKFTAGVLSENCHKTYWALVRGSPSESALESMRAGGLEIRGAKTRPPISVRVLPKDETEKMALPPPVLGMDRQGTWMEIVLNEGRNRQVRRITGSYDHSLVFCTFGYT